MTWSKGQDIVEGLLATAHLEQVPANPDEAQYLLLRARDHLGTAAREAEAEPEIAYDALYAAQCTSVAADLVPNATRAPLVPALGRQL